MHIQEHQSPTDTWVSVTKDSRSFDPLPVGGLRPPRLRQARQLFRKHYFAHNTTDSRLAAWCTTELGKIGIEERYNWAQLSHLRWLSSYECTHQRAPGWWMQKLTHP